MVFRRLSGDVWKRLDKQAGPNKSTVANCPKSRCVRYVRASEYAQKMERLAPSHRWNDYEFNLLTSTDEYDDFSCKTCGFPNELASVDKSESELFLRI